ncbi:MAG: DUF5611 family protein [Candidatus Methanoperedens sp.]|uniref:DUF5611 family protein n=1 Tax=Candidatus Methanoperedens nitratireducens TaxID=1392998 RepID=UPI0009DC93E6|nr:DUF5611 family protein [Candidatus Methanoperedens nitroreducens]MDJ1422652.1 DUF5611 family protein [Candidatus Methanoperedens sp.]
MQEYSFKRGSSQDIARVREVLERNFSAELKEESGKYTLSYGAFKRLTVWVDKKKLYVDTESNKEARDEAILDTNKRYRDFLEEATGYTAKERLARAKKEVQEV